MMMELSGRVSWICLLFGLAAFFPADCVPMFEPRGFRSPEYASPRSFMDKKVVPGSSQLGMSSGSSGYGVFSAGSGSGSGAYAAGSAMQPVFQDLQSMGNDLDGSRKMRLGQVWNDNNQVAFGSVEKRPVYAASHVVHYNSGYQRARDSRTDQKYVKDTFGHIPLPEVNPGQKGGTGSKGQQVY